MIVEMSVKVDARIIEMAVSPGREHIIGVLATQEIHNVHREETSIEDEDLSTEIELTYRVIERCYVLHAARQ